MIPFLASAVLAVHLGSPDPGATARQPQLAANASTVVLAFGAGKAIYFSASHDRGKTFSAPTKVAEASVIPLGRHRGPRIALSGSTIVITAVTGNKLDAGPHSHGLASDGDLNIWRSKDGGKTWSQGKPITTSPGPLARVFTLSPPTARVRSLRHGSTSAAATAQGSTRLTLQTTAPRGQRMSSCTNRPRAAFANAAIPRWRSTMPVVSW